MRGDATPKRTSQATLTFPKGKRRATAIGAAIAGASSSAGMGSETTHAMPESSSVSIKKELVHFEYKATLPPVKNTVMRDVPIDVDGCAVLFSRMLSSCLEDWIDLPAMSESAAMQARRKGILDANFARLCEIAAFVGACRCGGTSWKALRDEGLKGTAPRDGPPNPLTGVR